MQDDTHSKFGLTALIITYNEMGYIEKCIDSVSFADEIVVVDSYSNDGTFEYLQNHLKVRVIQHPFENFTAQKSFALTKAKHDWVLFLDADEVVSAELQKEIIETLKNADALEAYWCYRKFMFQEKHLRFSGWQTDKNLRLFKKDKAQFTKDRLVHETLQVKGKTGQFQTKLTHFCYKDYQDYREKMLHYGNLKAKELFKKGKRFSYLKLVVKPLWKFTYNFFFRLGFLDFERGLTICYLNALSVYQRYMVLKRLERLETVRRNARPLPAGSLAKGN